jgi:hypothetical protein
MLAELRGGRTWRSATRWLADVADRGRQDLRRRAELVQPAYAGRGSSYYLLVEDEEPLGLLLDAAEPPLLVPPLMPPVLLLPPLMPPVEDEAPPPLVLPAAPESVLELELEGELGVVVDEDEEEPPGTTTVSFSFVEVDVEGLEEPPGTTVVVSLRSQPERARAPTKTNR